MEEVKKRVLDRGFVTLIDLMGDDQSIVRAARVSYGDKISTPEQTKKLIQFLWNTGQKTPFEHTTFQFYVKAPIFVARQWVRDLGVGYEEISEGHTRVEDDFYNPAYFRTQTETLPPETCNDLHLKFKRFYETSYNFYKKLSATYDLTKEQARMILPLGMYTEFYFTVNAHALLSFLKTKLDSHAQWETREYAEAILEILKDKLPLTTEAFIKKDLM